MAFIPFGGNAPRLGNAFGTGLTQPIHRTLDILQDQKLKEIEAAGALKNKQREQQQWAQELERIGVPRETSQFVSSFRPEDRLKAFQYAPSISEYQDELKAIDRDEQQYNQQQQTAKQPGISGAQTEPEMQNEALETAGINPGVIQQNNKNNFNQRREAANAKLRQEMRSPQQKYQDAKLEIAQESQKLAKQAQQGKQFEQLQKFNKGYVEKAESSKKNIRDYNDLGNLALDGKLLSGGWGRLLKHMGLDDKITNYETEIAQKLINRLAQNAQAAFGNTRITNFLEATFQKSLPSLWNTDKGIWAISQLNKAADSANIVKDEMRQQILRENPDIFPRDLQDEISRRSEPLIREAEQKVERVINNPDRAYSEAKDIRHIRQNPKRYPGAFPADSYFVDEKGNKLINYKQKGWLSPEEYARKMGKDKNQPGRIPIKEANKKQKGIK